MGTAVPKQFMNFRGKPLWHWSALAFAALDDVSGQVLVVPPEFVESCLMQIRRDLPKARIEAVIAGGASRQESVRKGLEVLPQDTEIVAVHDAARPLIATKTILQTLEAAKKHSAALPVASVTDTIHQMDAEGKSSGILDRNLLKRAQTPQIFDCEKLLQVHFKAAAEKLQFTDDASLFAHFETQPALVENDLPNPKITTAEDYSMYDKTQSQKAETRCGQGVDVHPFKEGRKLILGGVEIPHDKGLDGHSDADVLAHAVTDALLGGANLGDIGAFYPSCDERYRDADSLELLKEACTKIAETGFVVDFVDATVIAQEPKIAPFKRQMAKKMAAAIGIDPAQVSVKATTSDHLGFTGRGEGIMALCIATLTKDRESTVF